MRVQLILSSGCALVLAAAATAQTSTAPAQTGNKAQPAQTGAQPQTGAQARPGQTGAPAQSTSPFPNSLYQMSDVSRALNLTPDQVNRLNQTSEQLQSRYRDQYNQLNSLNANERAAKMAELNRSYYADWTKGTSNIFNDTQASRYQQLQLQYGGFNSLSDPNVQRQLNLTQDQMKNLSQLNDWSSQQMAEINRQAATDRDRGMQLYRDYQTQYQDRFNRFLTPEQQRTWGTMTGQPFSFQPSFTNTTGTQPRR